MAQPFLRVKARLPQSPDIAKAARAALILGVLLSTSSTVRAGQNEPWDEYSKQINNHLGVGTLGPTLFGDQVSYYSGSLSFSNTDVSIPGNSSLPVAVTRTFTVTDRKSYDYNDLPFADWDIDLPNISGTFLSGGPKCAATSFAYGDGAPPSLYISGATFVPDDFWHGNHANLPGGGGEMVLIGANTPRPSSGGPYYWISGQTVFSCLPNGGFLALTADGTRYWFDQRAAYYEPEVVKQITFGDPTKSYKSRAGVSFCTPPVPKIASATG